MRILIKQDSHCPQNVRENEKSRSGKSLEIGQGNLEIGIKSEENKGILSIKEKRQV